MTHDPIMTNSPIWQQAHRSANPDHAAFEVFAGRSPIAGRLFRNAMYGLGCIACIVIVCVGLVAWRVCL